jgi:hypothetical protein
MDPYTKTYRSIRSGLILSVIAIAWKSQSWWYATL